MKHTMKLLSIILSICMVLGMLPLSAFATEELCYTVTIDGVTTNYTNINEAFNAASAAQSATIILHQDVSVSVSDLTVSGGNVTLDLNGRTSAYPLSVTDGILTVKDSATNKGTVASTGTGSLVYFGGKLIIEDSVDAYGEADGHEPWGISLGVAADVTVTAGSTGTENIVIPEDTAVLDEDGNEYNILPDGTPLVLHRHMWSALTCTQPKACICGKVAQEAPGHSFGSDGACTVCGYDPSKTITINMTDTYGDGWNGNTIKIYEDGKEFASVTLESGTQGSWTENYDSSKNYTFKWEKASYSEECSFEIVIDGDVVFTASNSDCAALGAGQQIYPTCEHALEKGETVEATCTDGGYTVYICALCGGVWEKDVVSSTGHTVPEEGVTEFEPTCTEMGGQSYTCVTCGDLVEEYFKDALGHTLDDSEPVHVEPSCTQVGCNSYTCDRCGEWYDDDFVPPLGHLPGEDGNCTVCGEPYELPVTVSGEAITVENMDDVLGDGTVSYDPETNTLTLNGYTYDGTDAAIYSEVGLNIKLVGMNRISTENKAFSFEFNVGNVQILGSGELLAQTGSEAIWINGSHTKLTIGGGVRLVLQPEEQEAIYIDSVVTELVIKDRAVLKLGNEETPLTEECIYVYGEDSSMVTVTDRASISCFTTDEEGIYAGGKENAITISGNPSVYINAEEEGLDADFITISGGEIVAYGGSNYAGIDAAVELAITGGEIFAGTTDAIEGYGIKAGSINITDGVLNVEYGLFINNEDAITLGAGMAITNPEGATVGYMITDAGLTDRIAVLNSDGTLANMVSITDADASEKIRIDVARMDLGNSLKFQFGIDREVLEDVTGHYAVIEKTWADGTVSTKKIPATKWGAAGAYWAITYDGLAAKEMNDTLYITIYNAEGEAVSYTREDSVAYYVQRSFDNQTDMGKTLLVDMLYYGTMAQIYFEYDLDEPALFALNQEQLEYASGGELYDENNLVKGDHYYGSRLSLESRIQLQVAFEGLTREMYAIYSFTDCNGVQQEIRVNGNQFVIDGDIMGVELDRLVYADARALITVTVYNADGTVYGSVVDSIESYCARAQEDALSMALMRFADSAKAYLYG